jgi:hypothetical protein
MVQASPYPSMSLMAPVAQTHQVVRQAPVQQTQTQALENLSKTDLIKLLMN